MMMIQYVSEPGYENLLLLWFFGWRSRVLTHQEPSESESLSSKPVGRLRIWGVVPSWRVGESEEESRRGKRAR